MEDNGLVVKHFECLYRLSTTWQCWYDKNHDCLDKGIKKRDYAAHGVQEYWIVDPKKQEIQQYILLSPTDKQYPPAKIFTINDDIQSRVIEGFVIPVRAIFEEEANLVTLQKIIQAQ